MIVKIVSGNELSPGGWTSSTVTMSAVARSPHTPMDIVRLGIRKGSATERKYFPIGTPWMAPANTHVLGMEFHARKEMTAATGKKRAPNATITANRLRKKMSAHGG